MVDRAVLGESNERASWKKGGYRSQESMEGHRRKPRRDTAVHRNVLGVQDKSTSIPGTF